MRNSERGAGWHGRWYRPPCRAPLKQRKTSLIWPETVKKNGCARTQTSLLKCARMVVSTWRNPQPCACMLRALRHGRPARAVGARGPRAARGEGAQTQSQAPLPALYRGCAVARPGGHSHAARCGKARRRGAARGGTAAAHSSRRADARARHGGCVATLGTLHV